MPAKPTQYLSLPFSATSVVLKMCCLVIYSFTCSAWCALPAAQAGELPPGEDPVLLSKEIISGHPEHWGKGASKAILDKFGGTDKISGDRQLYRLLESPGITLDAPEVGGQVSREQLLDLLKHAVSAPGSTSRIIAAVTLQRSLEEYGLAYGIASGFLASGTLSTEDALSFLDNRYGYAKLEEAKNLHRQAAPGKEVMPDNDRVRDKLKALERSLPKSVSQESAIQVVYEFYSLMEEEQLGIAAYKPYRQFREVMEELNRSRIAQRRIFRSSIAMLQPRSGTVWQLNEAVNLEWQTTNIGEDKSLRFFLVKGEMVVQELGKFKNAGTAGNIRLNKNIDSGDDYRVVAIEMFPANKYYIAKVASPPFSIRRPVRKLPPAPTTEDVPPAIASLQKEAEPRLSFDGRSISYVKELTVDTGDIRISLWDHGRQDQDIVSIYLNGSAVVAKHSLTYHKTYFDVHLETGSKNDLFLYAHNLGKYPPNTVSIEIADNSSSENIVLNSDLKSCEAVLINVRP